MLGVLDKPIEAIQVCVECLVKWGILRACDVLIIHFLEVIGHCSHYGSMEVQPNIEISNDPCVTWEKRKDFTHGKSLPLPYHWQKQRSGCMPGTCYIRLL